MTPLVVLPHADFTQTATPPEGYELLDVARGFVDRLTAPGELEKAIAASAAALSSADREGVLRHLQLCAGAQLLPSAHTQLRLRAIGAVLAAISGPPSPVKLRLDDLDLAEGTTERLVDGLSAGISDGVPYRSDVMAAVNQCIADGKARIRITQDQQLPALYLFSTFLNEKVAIELDGDFALKHREALTRFEPLRTARFVMELPSAPKTERRTDDLAPPEPIAWRDGGRLAPNQPFGGEVTLDELLAPEKLIARGCKVAVIPFAAITDRFLAARGPSADTAQVHSAVQTLTRAGVSVVGEWWLGAPGVGVPALEQTAQALESDLLPWVAGLRRFHWTRGRSGDSFGGVKVEVSPPPADRELARTQPFRAEGTLEEAQVHQVLHQFAQRLAARRPLVAGRVAEAYASPPAPVTAAPSGRFVLDPACAVVALTRSLEDPAKPTTYAVNLRTGAMLALDARVAPALAQLRTPKTIAEAVPNLPADKLAPLFKALVAKSVLVER